MYFKILFENKVLKFVSLATLLVVLASCGAGRTSLSYKNTDASLRTDILNYSEKFIGKPYRYAGKGPNSFDCSGFTSFVFKEFGFRLNSSSSGQERQFPSINKKENLVKGDLVFFQGSRMNGKVGHVGIVTETFSNGEFRFIHASTTNGVIISRSTEPYYAARYLRGGRVIEENSFYQIANQTQPNSTDINIKSITPATITLIQTDSSKNSDFLNQQSNDKKQGKLVSSVYSDAILPRETTVVPRPNETHIVEPGETLYSISKKYGCSVEQLKGWNPHLDLVLKAGEELIISPDIN